MNSSGPERCLIVPSLQAFERQNGIELAPKTGTRRVITGHIDFLQVRNGAVHILDYKPDAGTNKPIAQLAIYALALTRRIPGLRLFDVKCAWFNADQYCKFFPRTLLEPNWGTRRPSQEGAGMSS